MTFEPSKYDFRSAAHKIRERAREEFNSIPDRDSSLHFLAEWFDNFRVLLSEPGTTSGAFLVSALDPDSDNNPVTWIRRNKDPINQSLARAFQIHNKTIEDSVSPLAEYILGRACALSSLGTPAGTKGLTYAFQLFREIDSYGVSFTGICDQLSAIDLEKYPSAISQIDDYIREISNNPEQISNDERERSVLADWGTAVGIEQAVDPHFDNIGLDLPIRDVLLAFAASSPLRVAHWLDLIGHPALQASILIDADRADANMILLLLPHVAQCFDENGKWIRNQAARVLLDAFESRWLGHRYENKPNTILENQIVKLKEVMLARPDGKRLVLEWIAHLLRRHISAETTSSTKNDILLKPINTLVDLFGKDEWALPTQVWHIFGTSADNLHANDSAIPASATLPHWVDPRGQKDSLMPCVVAAVLCMQRPVFEPGLIAWIAAAFCRLTDEPTLLWLSVYPSNTLLNILSCPIGSSEDPANIIGQIWKDVSHLRLRARFFRTTESTNIVYHCNAIAELGLSTLLWLKDKRNAALQLMALMQDSVDEFRYCIPTLGLQSWAGLVSKLAIGCTVIGVFDENAVFRQFLERLEGDDDALVAACVACAANGIPTKSIFDELNAINAEPLRLSNRWLAWNESRYGMASPGVVSTKQILALITGAQEQ